eukprot:scaffold6557_cov105-Phaeocystis_antarctica.AAC.1
MERKTRNSEIGNSLDNIAKSQSFASSTSASGRISEGAGIDEAARHGLDAFDTTQIFVMPAGDWTRALSRAVLKRRDRR